MKGSSERGNCGQMIQLLLYCSSSSRHVSTDFSTHSSAWVSPESLLLLLTNIGIQYPCCHALMSLQLEHTQENQASKLLRAICIFWLAQERHKELNAILQTPIFPSTNGAWHPQTLLHPKSAEEMGTA